MEFKLLLVLCFNVGLIYSQTTKPIGSQSIGVTPNKKPTQAAAVQQTSAAQVNTGTGVPQFDLNALQSLFKMMQAAQGVNSAQPKHMPGVSSMPMPVANQISRNSVPSGNNLYQPDVLNTNVPYNGNNRHQQSIRQNHRQSHQQNQYQSQYPSLQFGANVNVFITSNHISSFEQMHLLRSYNLAEEQKLKILEEHNKLRSDVVHNQGAGAMNVLRWSEKLAAQASMEVMNCSYVNQGRGASLAAVYEKYTGTSVVSEFMNRWSEEKKHFALGENCSIQQSCRYSQAVWADTKEVGCAVNFCGDMSFIACSYSPVGNRVNQVAYNPSRGGICSACSSPPGMPTRCNSDHLCEWY